MDRIQNTILYPYLTSYGLEPVSPAMRRLNTLRNKLTLLQPIPKPVRHLFGMVDRFGRVCGIVKERTIRGAFQMINKAQRYDLAMQGNVPPLARFRATCLRCDSCNMNVAFLPEISFP